MAAPLSRSSFGRNIRYFSSLLVNQHCIRNQVNKRTISQTFHIPRSSYAWKVGVGAAVVTSIFATGVVKKLKCDSGARPVSRSVSIFDNLTIRPCLFLETRLYVQQLCFTMDSSIHMFQQFFEENPAGVLHIQLINMQHRSDIKPMSERSEAENQIN